MFFKNLLSELAGDGEGKLKNWFTVMLWANVITAALAIWNAIKK